MSQRAEVKVYTEQVTEGSKYKGEISVGGRTFDYEVEFTTPLPEFRPLPPAMDTARLRQMIPVTLGTGGKNIELSHDEYKLFASMVVQSAIALYSDPTTRANNQSSLLGSALRGEGLAALIGAEARVALTMPGELTLAPDILAMLTAAKFGCQFPA
jgi:hypothetical protein